MGFSFKLKNSEEEFGKADASVYLVPQGVQTRVKTFISSMI